jgi:hypothetical protein
LVVDIHHKPHGLTSLSRCHLSQVHKVQHKSRKKFSWGHNQIWSKGLRVCWNLAHQTLSGAPGPTESNKPHSGIPGAPFAIIHRTVRYATGLSGERAEQRLPMSQRSTAQMNSGEQCRAKVRGHWTVWCGTGLSGAAKRQRATTVDSSKP